MMSESPMVARRWMGRLLPIAVLVTLFALAGCKSQSAPPPPAAGPATMTVGFIYVGPKDDYGYNQAHAEGARELAKMPGVTIREEENVPETVAVQKTMESMINLDGAKLLFPTSFGYFDPHILLEAGKFPDVHVPPLRRALRRDGSTRRTSVAASDTSTRPSTSRASSRG